MWKNCNYNKSKLRGEGEFKMVQFTPNIAKVSGKKASRSYIEPLMAKILRIVNARKVISVSELSFIYLKDEVPLPTLYQVVKKMAREGLVYYDFHYIVSRALYSAIMEKWSKQ